MSYLPPPSLTWDVRRFSTLGSTNTFLLAEARAGAPAGMVAVTDYQSSGRGRLGRRWESPPGASLLVSVLLRPVAPPDELYAVTAAVALAAADACEEVAGVAVGLKWPNDLLISDRKVAGLLAEADPTAAGGPPGSVATVVGMGLNVTWPGPDPGRSTSLAASSGGPVDREEVLAGLLGRLAPRVDDLDTAEGRRRTVADLRRSCVTLGRQVRVDLGAQGVAVGTAVSLTDAGQLVVDTPDGALLVAAGDVVHLRTAGGAEAVTPPGRRKRLG